MMTGLHMISYNMDQLKLNASSTCRGAFAECLINILNANVNLMGFLQTFVKCLFFKHVYQMIIIIIY